MENKELSGMAKFVHSQRVEWIVLEQYLSHRPELKTLTLEQLHKLVQDIVRVLGNVKRRAAKSDIALQVTDTEANKNAFTYELFLDSVYGKE